MSEYSICLAGNPNVGKSTIFNSLTGMHQHTGNWAGKTVSNAKGEYTYNKNKYNITDVPGTYSIMSYSEEEEIARNYLCFSNPDCVVVVVDATTLERNLNLVYQIMEFTDKIVLCVNLLDEAKKKDIKVNFKKLQEELGIPVVGTIARKKKNLKKLMQRIEDICENRIEIKTSEIKYSETIEKAIDEVNQEISKRIKNKKISRWISIKQLGNNKKILEQIENNYGVDRRKKNLRIKVDKAEDILKKANIGENNLEEEIISTILKKSEEVCKEVVKYNKENYNETDRKIDRIVTSKIWGIPIMLLLLGIIFWITIIGANYPSSMLSSFFSTIEEYLRDFLTQIGASQILIGILVEGMFRTASWVVAVMLPPMAIFFPLFTLLEDLGYLPRIAFNLDNVFRKACTTGKQALTMCMGFGCNAVGVTGCRIIESPREKIIAMITNSFVPCNGRFPILITIASLFIGGLFIEQVSSVMSTIVVLFVILFGILMTFFMSKLLSKTILKGESSSFILELPNYRKPQIGKVIVRSIFDKTLFVLGRAVCIAAPAGIVIWLFANINIGDLSILTHVANFLDPFAKLMGLDGYILTAFILGIPANEIVLPIILMSYMANGTLIDVEGITNLGEILKQNGWTILTAINVMLFSLMHFPCGTTLLTIKKESGSLKWTLVAFALPVICGIVICMCTTGVYNLINFML